MGHLKIQGICGEKLGKFSELQVLLTSPKSNSVHDFGISETKLNQPMFSKLTDFKHLFESIIVVMAVEG